MYLSDPKGRAVVAYSVRIEAAFTAQGAIEMVVIKAILGCSGAYEPRGAGSIERRISNGGRGYKHYWRGSVCSNCYWSTDKE